MSIATVFSRSTVPETTDLTCVNTIRTLSMDGVQAANSGHPGTPMALAPVAYCLWQRFLRFDPQDPVWPNRDRFVLSIGHASMLLYSLLHLTEVRAVSKDYETLGEVSVPLDPSKRSGSWTAAVRDIQSTAGRRASRPPRARSARVSPPASALPSAGSGCLLVTTAQASRTCSTSTFTRFAGMDA